MAGQTNRYGLDTLGAGESASDNGFKFSKDDREFMDLLLWLGAEGHKHTGASADIELSDDPLWLVNNVTGGSIPASTRLFYKYAFVNADGLEGAASAEFFVDTPEKVAEPGAPSLVVSTTGGSLLPGTYYYAISAYTTVNTQETKVSQVVFVTVPVTTSTNEVLLDLPSLPSGATGFNIYRRAPGGARYHYLDSTTDPTYTDDGSEEEDCNRTLPVSNRTNGSNSVSVNLSVAVPVGSTWKLYRTFVSGQYDNSLLHHVVEETSEGSGIITTAYLDVGNATLEGSPRSTPQNVGSPSKIDLETETEGAMPFERVEGFPMTITHVIPGPVTVHNGTFMYPIEVPNATIQSVRAVLGKGSMPASTDVEVDVQLFNNDATPTSSTIFPVSNKPYIEVGETVGQAFQPDITEVEQGDCLVFDVLQAGGGATPTDSDLTITVYMIAYWTD